MRRVYRLGARLSSSRVVLMNHAKIEQTGTPAEIYDCPATPFVCSFLGSVNIFHGRISNGILRLADAEIPMLVHKLDCDENVTVHVRTHEATVTSRVHGKGAIPAEIRRVIAIGSRVRVELTRVSDRSLMVLELSQGKSADVPLQPGARVFVELETAHVFTASGAVARIQATAGGLGVGRSRPFVANA